MKIEYCNHLIKIYLYKYLFNYHQKEKLHREIRDLFVSLIKNYHINLKGLLKVNIYENQNYGCVLEIEKICDNYGDYIDLKIIVHQNIKFYLAMNNYYFLDIKDYFIKNNKYYVSLDKLDNLDKYIEYGVIEYNM